MQKQKQIHLYIYYNLEYKKFISLENDYYKEERLITSEVTIITNDKIVRDVLKHPKTKTNEYGEFIEYDYKYLENIVLNDLLQFKEKNKMSFDWEYELDSFYYVKCELIKDISNEIANFTNKV